MHDSKIIKSTCGKLAAIAMSMLCTAALPSWADTNITEHVKLTEDADWTSLGTVNIAAGAGIHLNGRNLTVSGFSGSGSIYSSVLPEGYAVLEYVDSTGAQYIDTGISPYSAAKIDADVAYIGGDALAYKPLLCSSVSDHESTEKAKCYGLWVWVNWGNPNRNEWAILFNGTTYESSATVANGTRCHLVAEWSATARKLTVDGASKLNNTTGNTPTSTGNTMYMPAWNSAGTLRGMEDGGTKFRFYSFKIYNPQDTLKRDYVPAKRLSDNVAGFYDRVSGTFFPSATETAFVDGPEIERGGGELRINVASGTFQNSTVAISNSVKVVKLGTGTYTSNKQQSYTGGNGVTSLVIKAGIVQRDNGTTATATFGANNSTIVVEDGGQFDIANNSGVVYYDFVLAGAGPDGLGALALRPKSITGHGYDSAYSIRHITLSADAAIGTNSKIGLKYTANFADHNVTLNNHTLTLTNGIVYAGAFTVVGGGRIVVGKNASFSFYKHNVSAPDCDVIVYGAIVENADVSPVAGGFSAVKSLVFETGSSLYDDKTKHMTNVIYERYAPPMTFGGSYEHLNVTLGNAEHLATSLDLSRFTGAFDGTTTTFYTGSTVTVDLAGRADLRTISKSASPYIITWSAVPENVTFVPDEQTGKACYRLIPESTGLKLECHKGFIISVY